MEKILELRAQLLTKLPAKYGNYLFFSALGFYLISQFINGTMYIVYYPSESFPYRLWMIAGALALLKIMLFDQFKDQKELALYVAVGLLILAGCISSQAWDFLYYYLMIVAARGIDFHLILKEFLVIISVGLVLTFISAKLGLIMGLTNSRDGSAAIRYALGTVYPTDLASRLFYLMLAYALYKKFRFDLPEYIGLFAMTAWMYIVTDTRLDMLLMLAIIFCGLLKEKVIKMLQYLKLKWIATLAFGSIFFVIIMTYLYQPSNLLFRVVNKVLSGRLAVGQLAFERYNVTLFGQMVIQNGNGGIHKGPFDYFFIDCSFLKILMMNGIVSFFILLGGIYYLLKRALKNQAYSLAMAVLLVILSSLIDHHMLEISYNIIFMALLADITSFSKEKVVSIRK